MATVGIEVGDDAFVETKLVGGSHRQTFVPPDARNSHGSITAVVSGATATVVSFVADADFRFVGFMACGDGDARYVVEYDGVPKYRVRTNIADLNALLVLPNPDVPGNGVTVRIRVTNNGTGNADFEGSILGE